MAARRLGLNRITWRRIGDEGDIGPPGPPGPGAVNGVIEVNDANHAAAVAHNLIVYTNVTADRTVTLPALSGVVDGFLFFIKDRSGDLGFTLTVDPAAAETIDGMPTFTFGTGVEAAIAIAKTKTKGWVVL